MDTVTRDRTTGTTEQASNLAGTSLEQHLARQLAGLDYDTRIGVIRRAAMLAEPSGELRTRSEDDLARQAYEKARESFRQTPNDPTDSPSRPFERLTIDNVEDAFTYHPWNPWQTDQGNQVRDALVHAAKTVLRVVPPTALRTRALNLLVDARMVANAAITHNGRF